MRLKILIGAATFGTVLALGGCEDKIEPAPAPITTAPAPAAPAPTAPAPTAPAPTAPAPTAPAPIKAKVQPDKSGVSVEADSEGGSITVGDDKTKTEIEIDKDGVGFKFEKTE